MGMPVKLSDDIVNAARHAAAIDDRSIAGQIEHWARLGRAAEAVLATAQVRDLKQAGADAAAGVADRQVVERLSAVAGSPDRSPVIARIRAAGRPVYEAAPGEPGVVVQVTPEGHRIKGRLVQRRFVPLEQTVTA